MRSRGHDLSRLSCGAEPNDGRMFADFPLNRKTECEQTPPVFAKEQYERRGVDNRLNGQEDLNAIVGILLK